MQLSSYRLFWSSHHIKIDKYSRAFLTYTRHQRKQVQRTLNIGQFRCIQRNLWWHRFILGLHTFTFGHLLLKILFRTSDFCSEHIAGCSQDQKGTQYPPATRHFSDTWPDHVQFWKSSCIGWPKILSVLPEILGQPEHWVYPKYLDIPRSKSGTRKYYWLTISTLLPNPNLPVTQGGRSCAAARGATTEKFGLGQKF